MRRADVMVHIDVAAGILWRDGRFLAAQRPPGSIQEGFWEFPGGKVEPGESPAEALIRELQEELGVTVRAPVFWRQAEHAYATPVARHVRLHFFHVRAFTGEPRACEGQALRWVLPREARTVPFLAADLAIVRELERMEP